MAYLDQGPPLMLLSLYGACSAREIAAKDVKRPQEAFARNGNAGIRRRAVNAICLTLVSPTAAPSGLCRVCRVG